MVSSHKTFETREEKKKGGTGIHFRTCSNLQNLLSSLPLAESSQHKEE